MSLVKLLVIVVAMVTSTTSSHYNSRRGWHKVYSFPCKLNLFKTKKIRKKIAVASPESVCILNIKSFKFFHPKMANMVN